MGIINLGDLEAGMVLAGPVLAPQGMVLLKAGETIIERHLTIFKTWGVLEVDIVGDVSSDKEATDICVDSKDIAAIEEQVEEKFSGVLDNDVMVEIMRIAKKHKVKQLYAQEDRKPL